MSIELLLVRQAGVISRRQALALGMSGDAVDRRISGRRWRPLHPRVYLTEGQRLTAEARVRAAMLWAGDGAVLSGLAAAWWWGLVADAPPVISITVPRKRNPGSHRGVRIRRRALAPLDLDAARDVAAVARPLAVLEAAVELGDAGGVFLDRALQGHVPFPLVYSAYTRFVGAHGATRAHALIVA